MKARDVFNLDFDELYEYFKSFDFNSEYFRATKKIYESIEEEALFGLSGYTKPIFFERCRIRKRHPLLDLSGKQKMLRIIKSEKEWIRIFYSFATQRIRCVEKSGKKKYYDRPWIL